MMSVLTKKLTVYSDPGTDENSGNTRHEPMITMLVGAECDRVYPREHRSRRGFTTFRESRELLIFMDSEILNRS